MSELGQHEQHEPPVQDCDCNRCAIAERNRLRKIATWAAGDQVPPSGVDVIGVWEGRDEFPPEVELCGIPVAGNPEGQWFNAYGPCAQPDKWIHVPAGCWNQP